MRLGGDRGACEEAVAVFVYKEVRCGGRGAWSRQGVRETGGAQGAWEDKVRGSKGKRAEQIRRRRRETEFGWRRSDLGWLPDSQVEDCHQSVGIWGLNPRERPTRRE